MSVVPPSPLATVMTEAPLGPTPPPLAPRGCPALDVVFILKGRGKPGGPEFTEWGPAPPTPWPAEAGTSSRGGLWPTEGQTAEPGPGGRSAFAEDSGTDRRGGARPGGPVPVCIAVRWRHRQASRGQRRGPWAPTWESREGRPGGPTAGDPWPGARKSRCRAKGPSVVLEHTWHMVALSECDTSSWCHIQSDTSENDTSSRCV